MFTKRGILYENLVTLRRVALISALIPFWYIKNKLKIPPNSEMETYIRLSWTINKQPRYTPDKFQFPFGKLRYIDGASLKSQYLEIFVRRNYSFEPKDDSPFIIDCGSNIGLSVIWFKLHYPKSRIIAFEPDPEIYNVLYTNIQRTVGLKSIKLVEAAIGNQQGQVGFISNGADAGRVEFSKSQKFVQAVRLSEFINEPVDLLKLDIEGSEYEVIQDLYESGKINYIRQLICEIHGRYQKKSRFVNLVKMLIDSGFRFTFTHARCAPDLPGDAEPTPFPSAENGKFLLHMYVWRGNYESFTSQQS